MAVIAWLEFLQRERDADGNPEIHPHNHQSLEILGLTFPAQVDLMDKLERKYHTFFSPREVSALKTFGDVVALVKKKVAMQGKPHDTNERAKD